MIEVQAQLVPDHRNSLVRSCQHRAKIMAGVSYEQMRGRTGTLDGTSYLIGFRTYFQRSAALTGLRVKA
jgi:hypothetical protein